MSAELIALLITLSALPVVAWCGYRWGQRRIVDRLVASDDHVDWTVAHRLMLWLNWSRP